MGGWGSGAGRLRATVSPNETASVDVAQNVDVEFDQRVQPAGDRLLTASKRYKTPY